MKDSSLWERGKLLRTNVYPNIKTFFAVAVEKNTISTSTKVALFVGSILALVNYGDRIFFHLDRNSFVYTALGILSILIPPFVLYFNFGIHENHHTSNEIRT